MFNSAFYSGPSMVDHRNLDSRNPDCSDFYGLNVDDLNIVDQLFWAVEILIVNRWIMFDIRVRCHEKHST